MPGTMCPPCDFSLESPACSVPSFCIAGLSSSQFGAWLCPLRGFAMELWEPGGKPFDGLYGHPVSVSPYLSMPGDRCWYSATLLCVPIGFQTLACGYGSQRDREKLARECGMGSSFRHFPCHLSAPLLLVSPLNTTADHFYVTMKVAFCSIPLCETGHLELSSAAPLVLNTQPHALAFVHSCMALFL